MRLMMIIFQINDAAKLLQYNIANPKWNNSQLVLENWIFDHLKGGLRKINGISFSKYTNFIIFYYAYV